MQRIWIGLFCIGLLFGTVCLARAAENVGPEAQKRMSAVLSELTFHSLENVDSKKFVDSEHLISLLHFAVSYIENRYLLSHVLFKPRNLDEKEDDTRLGDSWVSLKEVKKVVKRFFDYDLPAIPIGQYKALYFDGKNFYKFAADGEITFWAQVQEAKVLSTGNIAVKGVLRSPEWRTEDKTSYVAASFTAELKPILWKSMTTYAVVSLKSVWKGNE